MAGIREFWENKIGDNATIIQGDVNVTTNDDPKDEEREQNRLFVEKISKTDPFYDKKRILELKGPLLHESFEWILSHEDFQRWRNTEESGALWIKGDPGKGKTMLLCGIINDLEKNPGINSHFSYFFCQATDDRINTAVAALGGLIYSFFEPRQGLLRGSLSTIREKFENKLSQLSGPNAWQILCDIFEAIIQDEALPNAVCVVDALDECEHGVKFLLSLIAKTSRQIKWLISSRNVKEIELGLRSIDDSRRLVLELTGNAKCVSQSVDAYIDDSTRSIVALADDEDLLTKTTSTLKDKADGTFLWVSLVVEQLRDADRRNIEEVLEELPVGLENLYDLLMKRITQKLREKDQNACHILLAIVTTAERPLRLEELLQFIKFQWTDYKEIYDVRDMKDIVKDCGSFLSLKDDTVYFVHQSVKEYMVGKGAKIIFPSGVENRHSEMFKISIYSMSIILTYNIYHIKAPATISYNIRRPYPDPLAPIAYCCEFWVIHLLASCQRKSSAAELLRDDGILHNFLRDKFLCWLEALILLGQSSLETGALQKIRSIIPEPRNDEIGQSSTREMIYAHGKKRDSSLDNGLGAFIDDACKFIIDCKAYVCRYPLQLYFAAFVFGDKDNTINKTFQQTIHTKFGDLPTLTKVPLRRFSCIQIIRPETIFLDFVLFSPDSSLLCAPQMNGTIFLWKITSGVLKREIELFDPQTTQRCAEPGIDYYLAFSTDSSRIIFVSSGGLVKTWSIDDKTQVQRHRLHFMDTKEKIIALAQNGDLAASVKAGGTEYLTIWTTKTGDQTQTIYLEDTSNFPTAAISPDSALIALMDESGFAIYLIQTGKNTCIQRQPRATWDSQEHEYGRLSKFSPNSEVFAYADDSGNIELWSTDTWTIIRRITSENLEYHVKIRHFTFSSDSETYIMVTSDTLLFGSIATSQSQRYDLPPGLEAMGCISRCSWSRIQTNSSWLLAARTHDGVEIWLFNSGNALAEAHNTDLHSGEIIYLSPDSKLIAAMAHCHSDINIVASETSEVARVLIRTNPFRGKPAFCPGSYLLAGQIDDTDNIHIWDINTGAVIQELQSQGCNRTAVAFSHDKKHLVADYFNVTRNYKEYCEALVKIWCVESGQKLHEFSCQVGRYGIHTVAISAGLELVAICDRNHELQLWEPRTGHCICKFIQRNASDLTFSSDSKVLAVISLKPTKVKIWETATATCLFHVGIGCANFITSFDPFTGNVMTAFNIFKTSNWKDWDQSTRHGYSYYESWIHLDGRAILFIPSEFKCRDEGYPVISDSLMAYTSKLGQLIIIKFPECHGLKGQETRLLDAGHLAEKNSGLYTAKRKRL
ncbi:hypothetical protein MKX08_002438, partial [Trichoderma sp. CBMAI-0020]